MPTFGPGFRTLVIAAAFLGAVSAPTHYPEGSHAASESDSHQSKLFVLNIDQQDKVFDSAELFFVFKALNRTATWSY